MARAPSTTSRRAEPERSTWSRSPAARAQATWTGTRSGSRASGTGSPPAAGDEPGPTGPGGVPDGDEASTVRGTRRNYRLDGAVQHRCRAVRSTGGTGSGHDRPVHAIWGSGRGPAEDRDEDGEDGARAVGGLGSAAAELAAAEVTAAATTAEDWLARVTATLPDGRPRPQQATMARSVAAAIAGGRHLVVQAGTGTGKSLAYVVPAVAPGRKVVVATATKALQDQLAQKDLPAAAKGLPRPFSFAVLKGRSNYLCLQRAAEMDGRGHQQELTADPVNPEAVTGDPAEGGGGTGATGTGTTSTEADGGAVDPGRLVDQVRQLLTWSGVTETGDRADLSFEPHPRAWAMVSVGPRECPGAFRCPSGGRCFAERARAEAAAADVVVVNTHLYGAHLASGGMVLPEHDVVVFDEA